MQKPFIVIVLLSFVALAGCSALDLEPEDYHAHADIMVLINGEVFDFNKAQYMSTATNPLSENVHMHDFNPHVVHFHNESATLGDFFRSVGMSIDSRCFNSGNSEYCSDGKKNLFVYVNGLPLALQYDTYIPKDLDKIVVHYGESVPSQELLGSVTSESCIYSKKCLAPPGFDIGNESCSGTEPCRL
ncbi:MAG TPA: hypothetical protein VJH23_02855 [archaeon]|nr:hypothetical protein [archaeon]